MSVWQEMSVILLFCMRYEKNRSIYASATHKKFKMLLNGRRCCSKINALS